jgi:hypothetical protein
MSENQEQEVLPRIELLREAAAIIAGDRDKQYGAPEDNFKRISRIWSVIIGVELTEEDVAMMMIGLKVARYANRGGFQPDSWRDIAGYAGCGYEVGLSAKSKNAVESE